MTTTVAPDLKPDHPESEDRPTLVRSLVDTTPQEPEVRSFDPTQGRRVGTHPYDDLAQGRQIGSHPYDDPTQGRQIGSHPHDDPTRVRL